LRAVRTTPFLGSASCVIPVLFQKPSLLVTLANLALEARVTRRMLRERVEITFAVCTKHMLELKDPNHCQVAPQNRRVTAKEQVGARHSSTRASNCVILFAQLNMGSLGEPG